MDVPLTLNMTEAYKSKMDREDLPENSVIRAQDPGFAYLMIKGYQGDSAFKSGKDLRLFETLLR